MFTILLVIHTILVVFLIMMVLIQRTDSDGLSGLGGGGNQFLTGRSQANLLTRTTAILAGAFMITSLVLASMAGHMGSHSIVDSVVTDVPSSEAPAIPAKKTTAPEEKAKPKSPVVPKPE